MGVQKISREASEPRSRPGSAHQSGEEIVGVQRFRGFWGEVELWVSRIMGVQRWGIGEGG